MAPLNRSFSLPVSVHDRISRLKAFSGAAGKDEVSNKNKSKAASRDPSPLKSVPEGVVTGPEELSPKSHPVSQSPALEAVEDREEVLAPSPVDEPIASNSLPSSSSRRWSAVLGLGKLSRKRGSSGSSTEESFVNVDHTDAPRDITPASSVAGSDADAEDEGPGGRSNLRKNKDPVKRLTLTRTSSDSSSATITTEPQPMSRTSTTAELDQQATELIMQAFDRGGGTPNASQTSLNLVPTTSPSTTKRSGTNSALAALGLRAASVATPSTTNLSSSSTNESVLAQPKASFMQKSKPLGSKSAKRADDDRSSRERTAARAPSPFFRARQSRSKQRARDRSPEVGALEKDGETGPESDGESVIVARSTGTKFRPQASAYENENEATEDEAVSDDSADEDEKLNDEYDGLDEDGLEIFDDETEANTVANAVFFEGDAGGLGGQAPGEEFVVEDETTDNEVAGEEATTDARDAVNLFGEEIEVDPLGEGPNVIVPPEPLFATSMSRTAKRKTMKSGLELVTSRPTFARDRCTITLTHGEPDEALEQSGKRLRRYVVLSDISEESTYAVEWAIGTVARDGDEVFLVTVKEDESKVDPKNPADQDRATRLRVQKERQTQALLLVRQVTGLLQRTRLNITVTCQALHAKNARYMLLDLIDFLEPTMVIVGSRGLGKLKGILLGSTSHYLVQKSSVPVMVARRRLQRPLRKTNPANLRHSPRVSLASASIEKSPSSKQEDDVMDVAVTEGASDKESRA